MSIIAFSGVISVRVSLKSTAQVGSGTLAGLPVASSFAFLNAFTFASIGSISKFFTFPSSAYNL
jgi:hypothetical protein